MVEHPRLGRLNNDDVLRPISLLFVVLRNIRGASYFRLGHAANAAVLNYLSKILHAGLLLITTSI